MPTASQPPPSSGAQLKLRAQAAARGSRGRVAQLARAPRLHRGGRPFELGRAHCDSSHDTPARSGPPGTGPASRPRRSDDHTSHAPPNPPKRRPRRDTRRGRQRHAARPHRRDRRRPRGLLRRRSDSAEWGLRGPHRGRHARAPTHPLDSSRSGVAPDHPKIKSVTRIYEKTAVTTHAFGYLRKRRARPARQPRRALEAHHALRLRHRRPHRPTRSESPAKSSPAAGPATEFVGWYNGHPDHPDLKLRPRLRAAPS